MDNFYNKTILRIKEYNKKIDQFNESIMITNNINNLYFYKSMLAEYESKKYKNISVLLELGYSIVQIEKDIDNYENN